jgi:hypothetical protein
MVCCTGGAGGAACQTGAACATGLQLCTVAMANSCPADLPACRFANGVLACRASLPEAGAPEGGPDGAADTGTELDTGTRRDTGTRVDAATTD